MIRRMGAETGQDLVEYALVLPVFLLLIFSVIEFSILFFQYTMVVNAAREGARAGIVVEGDACSHACVVARVNSAARAMFAGVDPSRLTVTTEWPASPNGSPQVRVTVRYQTSFITQMLIQNTGGKRSLTLGSTATMQREY